MIYNKKLNRKIVMFFAVFLFSFNTISIYNVSADAASLTVTGGSIGTQGLEELAGLFPYAAPIILGIINQANMEIRLSEESQAAGMTKTQYLYDQILNWKEGAPDAVSQVCQRILTGTSVDTDGIIYVGQIALDLCKQFGNWVIQNTNDNFINRDDFIQGNPEYVQVGNVNFVYTSEAVIPLRQTGFSDMILVRSDQPFMLAHWSRGTNARPVIVTNSNTPVHASTIKNGNVYSQTDLVPQPIAQGSDILGVEWTVTTYFQADFSGLANLADISTVSGMAALATLFANMTWSDVNISDSPSADGDSFIGTPSEWLDFVPGLSLPAGYTGAIDFGILNKILQELEESKNFEMTVEDYLEAINEAVNDKAIDVPVENVDDGTIAYVPDIVIVPDPVYDPVADPDIPVPEEVTPVIDDSVPADFDDLISQPLTLDLKNFFPFCIPFDLYNLFQKFNAPAVAPNFRINFTVPIVNVEVDYTIDFSPFNTVASILRTMELIAMVVLLAIATRRIFLRG